MKCELHICTADNKNVFMSEFARNCLQNHLSRILAAISLTCPQTVGRDILMIECIMNFR